MIAKYEQMIKLFSLLAVSTVFIFGVSYFGSMLTENKEKAVPASSGRIQNAAKNLNQKAVDSQSERDVLINEAVVKMAEVPDDLQTFLDGNSKIELPAQASFSLLKLAKKEKLETINSDTLSLVATAIYQAILPTNFTMEERNIGSELPPYAKLGYEAKVNPAQNQDLAFQNPNRTNYQLEMKMAGASLIVDLKGAKLQYSYKITAKNPQQLKPKTIAQYSPQLLPGQTKVMNAGKSGQTVQVYREVYQGDIFVKSEFIADDYYPPEYRVEVMALAVPSTPATPDTPATPQGTPTPTGGQPPVGVKPVNNTPTNPDDSGLWGKQNEESK